MGVPVLAQQKRIRLGTMKSRVWSLASLSGLRTQCYRELWCRLQTWLRSGVAMALVEISSCSSNWTPTLGTSICQGCSPLKKKKKATCFKPLSGVWSRIVTYILLIISSLIFFFFPFCHICSMHNILGRGSNLCHSSNLSHNGGNTASLTHCATREFSSLNSDGKIWLNMAYCFSLASDLISYNVKNKLVCVKKQQIQK